MKVTNATDSALNTSSHFSSESALSTSVRQGIYWSVAVVALGGNLLFCIALVRQRREVFRKPYTIIVFTLSVTDMLTAIFLFISPRYIFEDTFPQPSSLLGLRFFCVLIWSRAPLFYFGVVSLYLTVLLTVDRWVAVLRPTQYQVMFTRKRAIIGVAISFIVVLITIAGSSPDMEYHPEKPVGQRCAFSKAQPWRYKVTASVAFFFKSLIPFLAIAALYLHMFYKLKTGSLVTQQHSSAIKRRITKVAALASLLLFISWIPRQVAFLFFVFGKLPIPSTTMDLTAILLFANSCVNPYLYGLTVQKYRQAYWELIKCCCPCALWLQEAILSGRVGHEITASERNADAAL